MENKLEASIDHVRSYETLLKLPREEVTLYELEHPPYETEFQFIQIMGAWEKGRSGWSQVHNEICPKPKRKPGRPGAKKEASNKTKYAATVNLGLPDNLLAGIVQVRGELSMGDCIRQLLEHALGPLAGK